MVRSPTAARWGPVTALALVGLVVSLLLPGALAGAQGAGQGAGSGAGPGAGPCGAAIAATERAAAVPDRLMQAIAIVESGRASPGGSVAAWPWTINVEGVGESFDTKQQAIAAVLRHQAEGARSIDVGCMQVNLMHHPDAFASLEEAFDPAANARYAARFLRQLLDQTGSWPLAVAAYHSLTPGIGADYARKVLAVWARPDPAHQPGRRAVQPAIPPPQAASGGGGPVASLPGGAPAARILPAGGSHAPTMTGRGLDSYRSMPTRTSFSVVRRF